MGRNHSWGDPCGAAARTPEGARLTPVWMGAIAGGLALKPRQTVVDASTASQNTADMGEIKLVDGSV